MISGVDKRSNLNKEQDKENDPPIPLETSSRPSLQTPASSSVSYKSKTAKGKSKAAKKEWILVVDSDLESYKDSHVNRNTRKKTNYDFSMFKSYITFLNHDEDTNVEDIPSNELNTLLMKYLVQLRKTNGDENETIDTTCSGQFDQQVYICVVI